MIEHDILYALRGKECPICMVKTTAEDRYIKWFLMENYNQASALSILAEGGFCRHHVHKIAGVATHQLSVTYDFIVKYLAEKIKEVRGKQPDRLSGRGKREKHRFDALKRKKPCPVCNTMSFYEKYAVNTVVKLLSEASTRELYQKSSGFCLDHLLQVLELAGHEVEDFLLDDYKDRLEGISADFEEYFRKLDYRNAAEPKGAEQDTWRRAVNLIHGGPDQMV
jgi:hypothetical protein